MSLVWTARVGRPPLTTAPRQRMFRAQGMATAPAPADDLSLLRRASTGDSAAVLALYDRHSGAVMALAVRILGNRDEAEDIVQEAFVRVWQEAASYDASRAGFRAWICTIARNRALDLLRRRGTASRAAATGDPPPEPERPDALASLGQGAMRVRAALKELPDAQRQALELAYFAGLTHVEIAEKTRTPLGTVKTRILDGMRKLKALLDTGDLP